MVEQKVEQRETQPQVRFSAEAKQAIDQAEITRRVFKDPWLETTHLLLALLRLETLASKVLSKLGVNLEDLKHALALHLDREGKGISGPIERISPQFRQALEEAGERAKLDGTYWLTSFDLLAAIAIVREGSSTQILESRVNRGSLLRELSKAKFRYFPLPK